MVRILHPKKVRAGVGEMQVELRRRGAPRLDLLAGRAAGYGLPVEVDLDALPVGAGIALRQLEVEGVVPGGGRRDGAAPAHAEVFGRNSGHGSRRVPVEVDLGVGPRKRWLARQLRRRKILALQARLRRS